MKLEEYKCTDVCEKSLCSTNKFQFRNKNTPNVTVSATVIPKGHGLCGREVANLSTFHARLVRYRIHLAGSEQILRLLPTGFLNYSWSLAVCGQLGIIHLAMNCQWKRSTGQRTTIDLEKLGGWNWPVQKIVCWQFLHFVYRWILISMDYILNPVTMAPKLFLSTNHKRIGWMQCT